MVDMSADDAVQLPAYNNVECIIMVALWEVCCIGWARGEACRHTVHACFTTLFWTIRTTDPTCKYCPTQHQFLWYSADCIDTDTTHFWTTATKSKIVKGYHETKLLHNGHFCLYKVSRHFQIILTYLLLNTDRVACLTRLQ